MTTPFDNMSPEKAQFIKQIVSDAAGKNQNELLPFLLNINRQIAGKHMSFSDEETDALVSQLTKNLSPKEKKEWSFCTNFPKCWQSKAKRHHLLNLILDIYAYKKRQEYLRHSCLLFL